MLVYGIIFVIVVLISLSVFVYMLERKIQKLESIIMHAFRFRTSLIPGLFEVTEDRFTKHDLIFRHILGLRTQEILSNNTSTSIDQILYVEQKIHKELNFIFKVANKHPKLLKDPKFIYVRNLFVDSSYAVGAYINMYQKIVKIYNNYVTMSRYSLFGLLLPISIKPEI